MSSWSKTTSKSFVTKGALTQQPLLLSSPKSELGNNLEQSCPFNLFVIASPNMGQPNTINLQFNIQFVLCGKLFHNSWLAGPRVLTLFIRLIWKCDFCFIHIISIPMVIIEAQNCTTSLYHQGLY